MSYQPVGSPGRDRHAIIAEAAASNTERERSRQQSRHNSTSGGLPLTKASVGSANSIGASISSYPSGSWDTNRRSNLSVLMHDRSDGPPSSSTHKQSISANSVNASPSPAPSSVFSPGTGSMLHAVSAYQHSLLSAAVALHTQSNPNALPNVPLSTVNTSACIGNHVFAGRIMGTIDLVAFHTCIQALVNRHSALRTSFQQIGTNAQDDLDAFASPPDFASATTDWSGAPSNEGVTSNGLRFGQLIHPNDAVAADFRHSVVTLDQDDSFAPIEEITSLRTENLPPVLATAIQRAAHEGFNVCDDASLFRVRLFQVLGGSQSSNSNATPISAKGRRGPTLAKEECTLFVFSLSALVGDVWSMTVLLDDFRVLYAGSLNMPVISLEMSGPGGTLPRETSLALDDMTEQVLEPLVMDYLMYAEWQKSRLNSQTGHGSIGNVEDSQILSTNTAQAASQQDQATKFWQFWAEHMSGTLPTLSLPNLVERPRMAVGSGRTSSGSNGSIDGDTQLPAFASVPFIIPRELTKRLQHLALSERTELNSILISAFQLFLFRYTGQDDVLLAAQSSCRSNLETQNVVGPFSNTVLYRSNTSGNHVYRDYLQQTRQQLIGVRAHGDYPMTLLIQRLVQSQQISPATATFPSLGTSSLFSASFDFEYPESSRFQDNLVYTVAAFASGVYGPPVHVGGLKLQPLELECSRNMISPFDACGLAMKLSEVGGELRGHLRYDSNLYTEELIQRMTGHWERLLDNIVGNPDVKVSDLNLLTTAERRLLIHEWNQTATIHLPTQYRHNPSHAKFIHTWFEAQVTSTPDALAVEYIDPVSGKVDKWSYLELNQRANQLAHYVRYLGIQPDQPVPIVVDRSPKLILCLLAVLKAGGAAMPLDPTVPNERVKFLIASSEGTLVLTETTYFIRVAGMIEPQSDRLKYSKLNQPLLDRDAADRANAIDHEEDEEHMAPVVTRANSHGHTHSHHHHRHSVYVLNLDLESSLIRTGNVQNLPVNIVPTSTAYVLFTSGSTGTPKGCMLSHANLMNYITWFLSEYSIHPTDRAAHLANMAFDASMMETWCTLCRGGCIVQGANDDIKLVPSKLVQWMQQHRITFTFLTTQLCHQFIEASFPPDFTLRYLFTGGEKLKCGVRDESVAFQLVNVYGPTETCINVTVHTVPPGTINPPPLGRPIHNTQLYIVDAFMQPVPLGICGELMIGGLGVGKGYFNRPDLTAEKFIANPFYHISPMTVLTSDGTSKQPGSQSNDRDLTERDPTILAHSPLLYKSGDLVRYRSDGLLEFVGRADQQLKLRGYRIELAEIEAAFLTHPLISEVCVIVFEQAKEKKLLAYLVTKEQKHAYNALPSFSSASAGSGKIPSLLPPSVPFLELKKYLKERLPSYMIPSAVLYIEFMPLTNNGKIHRQVLPLPDWNDEGVLRTLGQSSNDTFVPPATPIEKIVVHIARILLNLPPLKRISMSDNFFDLGGHSLSIGQLISKLDARVGIELHYSKVFESTSLGALAKTIHVLLGAKSSQVELTPQEMEEDLATQDAASTGAGLSSPPTLSKSILPTESVVRPSATPPVSSVSPAVSCCSSSPSPSLSADPVSTPSPFVMNRRPSGMSLRGLNVPHTTNDSAGASVHPLPLPVPTGPQPKFHVKPGVPYQLSYNQSSLLFLSELDPSGLSSLAYNIPFVARLYHGQGSGSWQGKNDRALQLAFEDLIERHTALRTIFPKRGAVTATTSDADTSEEKSTPLIQPPQSSPIRGVISANSPRSTPSSTPAVSASADEESSLVLTAADLAAGVAHQVVLDASQARKELDFTVVDGVSQGWTERDVKRHIVEQTYRPFDLHNGPIMRVRLIQYASDKSTAASAGNGSNGPSRTTSRSKAVLPSSGSGAEIQTVLLWTVHHIAVDLWSMVVLIEDLKILYAWHLQQDQLGYGFKQPTHATTTSITQCPYLTPSSYVLQYIHCIPSQLSVLQGAKAEKLWSYWLNQLAEPLPVLSVPTDKVRPPKQTYNGTSFTFPIPQRLHTALTGLAREEGVTMYTLLLSAFYALLHVYSGQDDIIVGSPLACRNDSSRENVVGYFVNPLPLRSNLAGNPSFKSYVSRVRQVVLGALSHQDLPFPLLAQRLLQGKERDPSRTPIWQVLFILQKPHRQYLAEQGLAMYFMNAPGVEMNLGPNLHMESMQIGGITTEDAELSTKVVWESKRELTSPSGHTIKTSHHTTATTKHSSTGGAYGQRHAQFDLALICGETHRDLCGAFHFNTDVYSLDTVRRMSEHFVTLLESVCANPAAKLSSLNVLPTREKEVLLTDWCATIPYDRTKLIHQLVEDQVIATPNALAICGKDDQHREVEQQVTYIDMNARANQIASYLRFAGVNLETPVFVLMNRTPLFIITLLACLKSGGSYVPIDPSYPKLRIEHIMEQAELKPENTTPGAPDGFSIVLCERSLEEKVPALTGGKSKFKLLFIDELESEVKHYGTIHNLPLLDGQTSASCMSMVFTSGSTGKPKGVQLLHRGLHSYCRWWNPYLQSGPHDRVSHLANVGFDASMTETWATLVCGASIFLCSEEIIRLTPSLFVQWITKHQITVAFLPTVLTEAFLDESHPPDMKLRCLYTGGDKLHRGPKPCCSNTRSNEFDVSVKSTTGTCTHTPFRLICCFGPCESTIGVTAYDVPVGMVAPPFNIGRTQPNVQILILDPNQKLLPIGTVGEICIGGQQLARGYYNRPDLTRTAFIQNPFRKTGAHVAHDADINNGTTDESDLGTSAVLYRSGDQGRYLPDGSLEFWGRADFQVKIRGNRIELGEIELALRDCAAIHEAVVVARSDAVSKTGSAVKVDGEKKIVAYYVLKRGIPDAEQVDGTQLRQMLRDKLPEFMVPSAFVQLSQLPLTPNGKIDRDALPAPNMDALATRSHLAPRNEVEEQLAQIVSSVLGVPKVGMMDNFFDLGGHSLAAAQLLSRIRDTLDVDLPLSKIFDTASMGGLAEAIEVLRAAPSTETRQSLIPALPSTPGSHATPFPASHTPGQMPPVSQRSALLAARMKGAPGAIAAGNTGGSSKLVSGGSPLAQSGRFFPSSPAGPSVGRTIVPGSNSPTMNTVPAKEKDTTGVTLSSTPVPSMHMPPSPSTPRLGSSPSKSSGLANFLAHKAIGGSASSRATGAAGQSGTATPTHGVAPGGVAVPFAAPTLGFARPNLASEDSRISSRSRAGSSVGSDGSDDGYQPLHFLSNAPSAGKHIRVGSIGAASVATGSGSITPSGLVATGSPTRPFSKKLARLRSDGSDSSAENSQSGVRPDSRRNSVSKLGATPSGRDSPATILAQPVEVMQPGDAPMTYSQSSLWFVNKLDPQGVTYTCVYGVQFQQPFEPLTLQHALYGLLLRHPSLRTSFMEIADSAVQRVLPPETASLDFQRRNILDGLGHDQEERIRQQNETEEQWHARVKKAWKKLLMQENHVPFDITRGPVFRARLFTVDEPGGSNSGTTNHTLIEGIGHGILHLMAHHIAVDGWSMELLMTELYTLYTQLYQHRLDISTNTTLTQTELYAHVSSHLTVLPPIPCTMSDRALSERTFLASPDGERSWNFWQRTLAPPLTLLEIHTDFPRPPIQTYKGDVFHFSLPSETIAGLRSLAKQENVTMFMALFSSFLILLHRYTGQEDLSVGTPMACRADMTYERTVGHFVNPVVLRANLTGDLTTLQLLDSVKRMTINAFIHQDYPFPLLVDRLQSFRDSSRNPLFQVLFSLNQKFQQGVGGRSSDTSDGQDIRSTLHSHPLSDLDQLVSPFDLQLIMTESESDLKADLTYNTALFTHATMQRMSAHLLELWKGMCVDPGQKISLIKMLPKVEYDLIVTGFNQPKHSTKEYYCVDVPKAPIFDLLDDPIKARDALKLRNHYDRFELLSDQHCVHRLFELQTRLTPGATAVVEYESYAKPRKPTRPASLFPASPSQIEPQIYSYAKLNSRANSLAHYMRDALGVRVGDVVVLLFFRCADWLVALLAALKCGAAYVPVDPAYPADRIRYMMADAKAKVLLTHNRAFDVLKSIHPNVAAIAAMNGATRLSQSFRGIFPPQLPDTHSSVVMVDVQWDDISLFDTINPEVGVTLQHLVYHVYTSGSSGAPKGVCIQHKSMYLIAKWHQLEYGVTEHDRVTQQTAPAFDPVGLELWSTWMAGASLHIVPDSVRSSPPALQTFVLQHQCSIAFMPTPICANMIDEPWPEDRAAVPLRVLTTGGDRLVRGPLPGSTFERLMRDARTQNVVKEGINFGNWYGPSECTIISTFFRVPPGFDHAPPIGRPVDNARVYIVDRHMKPVPIGVPGDIYIGGDCLAAGYLNRPELTHDKFRPNIFLNTDDEMIAIVKEEADKMTSASPPPSASPDTTSSALGSSARGITTSSRMSVSSPPAPSSSPVISSKRHVAPPPFVPSYPRIYESGDQGRWLPDGTIDFIGRKDFQVKIRGFRVELGEIETILAKHTRVSRCVVQVKSKGQGHQALAAYVVLTTPAQSDPPKPFLTGAAMIDELRSFSKQTLPEYMVPSVFVFLDALPETANGKIDLKALPEPQWAGSGVGPSAAAIVEPRNEIERKLCQIWCHLLQLGTISINDSFFELGGNSLTAARLLSAIKREMEVELNVSLLFHAPTVAGVADKIAFMKQQGSLADYVSPPSTGTNKMTGPTTSSNSTAAASSSPNASGTLDGLDSFDAKKDIVLDASICNPRVDHRHLSMGGGGMTAGKLPQAVNPTMHHPRSIFLTGVTGFLGVHLLAALLTRTDAIVYCLIRLAGGELGAPLEKILRNVRKFRLWDVDSSAGQALSKRIVPVLGDLSSIRLGISAQQWSMLASQIDGIIACGAFVNSVLPYSQLKAANVGGTHEVLRLATSGGKVKPVHHISTLSVFQSSYAHKITELEPLTSDGLSYTSGYPTSKYVADCLVLMAAKRGIPVAIYRPGRITGHSKTGLTSLDDFFTRLLKGCVQIDAFPDLDWLCDLTPVDWMANSIVALATHAHPPIAASIAETYGYPPQPCGVYHLHNPKTIHWIDLCRWLIHKHKYPCQILPYVEWLAKLQKSVSEEPTFGVSSPLTPGNAASGIPRIPSQPNVLAPLMTVFGPTRDSMGSVSVMPSFNSRYSIESIIKSNYTQCPEPDDRLLETYFRALNQQGFM